MAWTEAHDELFKKINREMDDFAHSMWDLPGYAVYSKANEIAAMSFCYNQLAGKFHDYSEQELKPLLDQEKPLEFLAHRWMTAQNPDLADEFDRIFRGSFCQSGIKEMGPSMA